MLRSTAVGHLVDLATGAARRVDRFQIDRCNGPAGATLWSDIAGLAAFGRLHLNGGVSPDGRRLLPEHLVTDMQRVHASVPWGLGEDAWGLGWTIRRSGDRTVIGHTGANSGAHSSMYLVPDVRWLIAVMANGTSGVALTTQLCNDLLEEHFDIGPPSPPVAPADPPAVDVTACRRGIRGGRHRRHRQREGRRTRR